MPKAHGHDPVPALEWAAAALGGLIALALLTIIGREALIGSGDKVPLLRAEVMRVVPTPAGHVVEVRVSNESSRSAAQVQIEGEHGNETRIATIDYVPGRSEVEAGLIFEQAPRGPRVRVTGYEVP